MKRKTILSSLFYKTFVTFANSVCTPICAHSVALCLPYGS
ncbi:hypothetical protein HMPREF9419_2205 [Prevotella nigrescens ATCC 33563]|nr:hypothetical protein HMPREF9419_2205 [Prevotella nigrescens ATCC 33563]